MPESQRVDYQTPQRLDRRVAPSITADDAFFDFLLSGTGVSYADVKAKAEKREPLPEIQLRDSKKLELVLRSGALPAPITPSNEQRIGPTLGEVQETSDGPPSDNPYTLGFRHSGAWS